MLIWKSLKSLYSKKMATQSVVYVTEPLIRNGRYTHGNIYSQKKIIIYWLGNNICSASCCHRLCYPREEEKPQGTQVAQTWLESNQQSGFFGITRICSIGVLYLKLKCFPKGNRRKTSNNYQEPLPKYPTSVVHYESMTRTHLFTVFLGQFCQFPSTVPFLKIYNVIPHA